MSQKLASRVHELTDDLHLTQRDIAEIVGASPRSVARWSSGNAEPQRDARRRLLELRYVADAASEVVRPNDVGLWMLEPNKLLEGDSPAHRIRDGRYRDVLAAIEAIAEGVVI